MEGYVVLFDAVYVTDNEVVFGFCVNEEQERISSREYGRLN